MKKFLLFIIVAFLHFCIEFFAWALHPGNAAVETSEVFIVLWQITSFPLITYLPADFADNWPWIIFFANSCLWSCVLLITISIITKRRKLTKNNK